MSHHLTQHAQHRSQQRGIPPLVVDWLLAYGQQVFDGHGGIVRFFDGPARHRLAREIGHAPVRRMAEFLRCYLVESTDDGRVITVGKRHPQARLPRH